MAAARAAAFAASSVHVRATNIRRDRPVFRVDAVLAAGRGGVARIFTRRGNFGIANVRGVSYVLVTSGLLDVISRKEAQLIEHAHELGKWITLPSGIRAVAALGNWTDFHGVLERLLSPFRSARKSHVRIRGGPPVSTFADATGKLTLFVAMTGKRYPLEIAESLSYSNATIVTFDRWNAPAPLVIRRGP
jgi:hypothetical protein